MTSILALPEVQEQEPRRLRMRYEEYLAWVKPHMHTEWADGEVIIYMPPKTRHQLVGSFLLQLLGLFTHFFRLGKLLPAPFEMKLWKDGPSREPDIIFVTNTSFTRLTEDRLEGPADLVIELISDESVRRDRTKKFTEYQKAGVPEYWLLDPRHGRRRAQFWVLDATGQYQEVFVGADGIYRSTVLAGFWLRVDWLWADELPEPLVAFGEIVGWSPSLIDAMRQQARRATDNG